MKAHPISSLRSRQANNRRNSIEVNEQEEEYRGVKLQGKNISYKSLYNKLATKKVSSQILDSQSQSSDVAVGQGEIATNWDTQHGVNQKLSLQQSDVQSWAKNETSRGQENLILQPKHINETNYPEIFPLSTRSYGAIFQNYYCLVINNNEVVHISRSTPPNSSLIFAKIETLHGIVFMQSINIFSVAQKNQTHLYETQEKWAHQSRKQIYLHINVIEYDIKSKAVTSKYNLCFELTGYKKTKQAVSWNQEQDRQNTDLNSPPQTHEEGQNFMNSKNKTPKKNFDKINEELDSLRFIKRIEMISKKWFPSTKAEGSQSRKQGQFSNSSSTSSHTQSLVVVIQQSYNAYELNTNPARREHQVGISNSIKVVYIRLKDCERTNLTKKGSFDHDSYQMVEPQEYSQHLYENETTIRKNWLRMQENNIYFITNKAAYQIRLSKLISKKLHIDTLMGSQKEPEHVRQMDIKCQNEKWLERIIEYEWSKKSDALNLNITKDNLEDNSEEGISHNIKIDPATTGPSSKHISHLSLQIVDCCWLTLRQCLVVASNNLTYQIAQGKVINCIDFFNIIKTNSESTHQFASNLIYKTIAEIRCVHESSVQSNFLLVRIQTSIDSKLKKSSTNVISSQNIQAEQAVVSPQSCVENQIYIFKHNRRWIEYHSKIQDLANENVMNSGQPMENERVKRHLNPKSDTKPVETSKLWGRGEYKINPQSVEIKILKEHNSLIEVMSPGQYLPTLKPSYFIFYQWGINSSQSSTAPQSNWSVLGQPKPINIPTVLKKSKWSDYGTTKDLNLFITEINILGKYGKASDELNPLCVRLDDYFDPCLNSIFQIKFKCLRNYFGSSEFSMFNEFRSPKEVNVSAYCSFSGNLFHLAVLSQQGDCRKLTMYEESMGLDTKPQHLLHVGLSTKSFVPSFHHYFDTTLKPICLCIDNLGLYLVVSMPEVVRLYYILKGRILKGPELNMNNIVYLKFDRFNWHLYAHDGKLLHIINPWKFEVERSIAFEGHILTVQVGSHYIFIKWKAKKDQTLFLSVFPLYESISEEFHTYQTQLDKLLQREDLDQYLAARDIFEPKTEKMNEKMSCNSTNFVDKSKQKAKNDLLSAELKYCFDACPETQSLFIINQYYLEIHKMRFIPLLQTDIDNRQFKIKSSVLYNCSQTYSLRNYNLRFNQAPSKLQQPGANNVAMNKTPIREKSDSLSSVDLYGNYQLGRSQSKEQAFYPIHRTPVIYRPCPSNCMTGKIDFINKQWPTAIKYEETTSTMFVGTNLGRLLAYRHDTHFLKDQSHQQSHQAVYPYLSQKASQAKIYDIYIRRSKNSFQIYVYTGNQSVISFTLNRVTLSQPENLPKQKPNASCLPNQFFQKYLTGQRKLNLVLNSFRLFSSEQLNLLSQQIQELELIQLKLKGDREDLMIKREQKFEKEVKNMEQDLYKLKISSRLEEKRFVVAKKSSLDHLWKYYDADRQYCRQQGSKKLCQDYREEMKQLYKQNQILENMRQSLLEMNSNEISNFKSLIQKQVEQIKEKYGKHLLQMERNIENLWNQNKKIQKIQAIQMQESQFEWQELKKKIRSGLEDSYQMQIQLKNEKNYFGWYHCRSMEKIEQKMQALEQLAIQFQQQIEKRKTKVEQKLRFYFQCKELILSTQKYDFQCNSAGFHLQNSEDNLFIYHKNHLGHLTSALGFQAQQTKKDCSEKLKSINHLERQKNQLSNYITQESNELNSNKQQIELNQKYLKQLKKKQTITQKKLELSRNRRKNMNRKITEFIKKYRKHQVQVDYRPINQETQKDKKQMVGLTNQNQYIQVLELVKFLGQTKDQEPNQKPQKIRTNNTSQRAFIQNSLLISDVNKLRRTSYSLHQKLQQIAEKYNKHIGYNLEPNQVRSQTNHEIPSSLQIQRGGTAEKRRRNITHTVSIEQSKPSQILRSLFNTRPKIFQDKINIKSQFKQQKLKKTTSIEQVRTNGNYQRFKVRSFSNFLGRKVISQIQTDQQLGGSEHNGEQFDKIMKDQFDVNLQRLKQNKVRFQTTNLKKSHQFDRVKVKSQNVRIKKGAEILKIERKGRIERNL